MKHGQIEQTSRTERLPHSSSIYENHSLCQIVNSDTQTLLQIHRQLNMVSNLNHHRKRENSPNTISTLLFSSWVFTEILPLNKK